MVIMSRSTFLQRLCKEAAEVLKLDAPYEDCILKLFRADGTIVLSQLIKNSYGLKPWTIERYMGLLQQSVSQVKLGVGQRIIGISTWSEPK